MKKEWIAICFSLSICTTTIAQTLQTIGRGLCSSANGILQTKDAAALFGDSSLTNYQLRFSARTPVSESQVQIWAGFRVKDRQDFYSLGLRGGEQNSLYLARRGYMGRDEFLALRPLGFHPVSGTWYDLRIVVSGDRIRVFLNNEKQPRIDVRDKNSHLLPSGKIMLGGGWITTEYNGLAIEPLSTGSIAESGTEFAAAKSKEVGASNTTKTKAPPQSPTSLKLDALTGPRTEYSLNGNWHFMPTYKGIADKKAISPGTSDKDWHIMPVPSFWNPIRIWLHGETFGPHAKGVSDNYFQQETDRCEAYTFDYKKTSQAWYRRWIELPSEIQGKTCELHFDAVSKVAEVYINGKKAGSHVGMFGDFTIDGTGLFVPGRNLIAVKVSRDYGKTIADADKIVDVAVSVPVTNKMVHDLPHGFYGGDPAGIWQPVKLVITNPVKITDVFVKPSLTGATIDVTVRNSLSKPANFLLKTTITGKTAKETLYNTTSPAKIQLQANEEKVVTITIDGLRPHLWSPQEPNLYDFNFLLFPDAPTTTSETLLDQQTITSGFRTFESKNGFFWLNGRQYWLRGANQTPFALEPDSPAIADHFFQLMKEGNIEVTRTHTAPYNETWMDAADRNGIGISYEGTWPWLMLAGSMPDSSLISLWADEFINLLKKYRNHPSLLLWTVNNEMKFYDNDPDPGRARLKMRIISEVVKRMRKTDPTRPISFDSNYRRNTKKFGQEFFKDIDDGDIDDIHAYINWYDYSIFKQFKGEFQTKNRNENRPLISQEMSTGYPNAETGHPTRFYTIVHQTPQSLIGDLAYENCDPAYFLQTHAFITGELAEAFRRSNPMASGILHFALITWFRNVYDRQRIEPYPVYNAMKRALRPVLVSAELWGRHFYAGNHLPARICIVNDATDGMPLSSATLDWQLVDKNGLELNKGQVSVPAVPYYGRQWITPEIGIPAALPAHRTEARLLLHLTQNNKLISDNEYAVLLADKEWSAPSLATRDASTPPAPDANTAPPRDANTPPAPSPAPRDVNTTPLLVDFAQMRPIFDSLHIPYTPITTVREALQKKASLYIFAGLEPGTNCSPEELTQIKTLIKAGGKALFLDGPAAAKMLYPNYIRGWLTPTEGDIANMEIPESPVFDGIAPLDLRYFNNNQRDIPSVCHTALQINRDPHVEALAMQMKVHGYVEGDMDKRSAYMENIKGFPIIRINDGGELLVSTMSLEKAATDPVPGRLLFNMIISLSK